MGIWTSVSRRWTGGGGNNDTGRELERLRWRLPSQQRDFDSGGQGGASLPACT